MKNAIKFKTIFILSTLSYIFLPVVGIVPAFADNCTTNCPPTLTGITSIVPVFVDTMLAIGTVVFLIMLIIGGYALITSNGDAKKIEAGKKTIFFTILGYSLLFLPFIVFPIIKHVTQVTSGIDVGTNGNISFNPVSTFTATPLPTNLINTNTATPTADPKDLPCKSSPDNCIAKLNQLDVSQYSDSFTQYDWVACVPTAETMVINYYEKYLNNVQNKFRIDTLVQYYFHAQILKLDGMIPFDYYFSQSADAIDSNLVWVEQHIGSTSFEGAPIDISRLQDAFTHGYPVIVDFSHNNNIPGNGHTMVFTGRSGNTLYVANPANTGLTTMSLDTYNAFHPYQAVVLRPNQLPPISL